MDFASTINKYMALTDCSSKELARESGLSETTISRYRSGQRSPSPQSDNLTKLAKAFEILGEGLNQRELAEEFKSSLSARNIDYSKFTLNLNTLINHFEINTSDLAKAINYDPSYLSRIKSMQRKPSNPDEFADRTASYILKHYNSPEHLIVIKTFVGETDDLHLGIVNWLLGDNTGANNYVSGFLNGLDRLNLSEIVKSNDIKKESYTELYPPLPESQCFYGTKEMHEAELRFFEDILRRDDPGPIYFLNTMPLTEILKEPEFKDKWFFYLALLLKRGLKIYIIHELNRTLKDMLYGFKVWVAPYMTGLITPYYLIEQSDVFRNALYLSSSTALAGECIGEKMNHGRVYFTRKEKEMVYYRSRFRDLMERSKPLMDIYLKENKEEFHTFMETRRSVKRNYSTLNFSLPICTMSDELLKKICARNNVSDEDYRQLSEDVSRMDKQVAILLRTNTITERIPIISREEFEKHPLTISTSGVFFEKTMYYTYEEYAEHLRLTKEYSRKNPGFILEKNNSQSFTNLAITIAEGRSAVISKLNDPPIHFVIHQPHLLKTLENHLSYSFGQDRIK